MAIGKEAAAAMLAVAAGVGAVVAGAVLGPEAGSSAGALVLGGALGNVGSGLVGTVTHDAIRGVVDIASRLRNAGETGRLPENHDLARAIRRSHLLALRFLVEEHRSAAAGDGLSYDVELVAKFSKRAEQWIERELRAADHRDFMRAAPIEQALNELGVAVEPTPEIVAGLGRAGVDAALMEFQAALAAEGVPLLDSFQAWFIGKDANSDIPSVGWMAAAQAFFAEAVKTNERLRTVIFLQQFKEMNLATERISSGIRDALAFLSNQDTRLAARFDRLEAMLDSLVDRQVDVDTGRIVEALIDTLTRADFIDALRRRSGVEAPYDEGPASRATVDVRDRIAELSKAFFGREAELRHLDAFINDNARGLMVVAAPAGGGKSALLAHWVAHRRARGDLVVRHFVSTRFLATKDVVDVLRHLCAQLRKIDGADPSKLSDQLPDDEKGLSDRLCRRLEQPVAGERLIIVLDGLDELQAPLADIFVRGTLAPGVFVVVSGRATAAEVPPYLRNWLGFSLGDVPRMRFDVPGLQLDDVLMWLEEVIGHLDQNEMRMLSHRLQKTTDGLPLFLADIFKRLQTSLPGAESRDQRLRLVSDLPASFSEYIVRELDQLEHDLGPDWTPSARKLFALLTRTLGPITEKELEALFAFRRANDAAFPACPVLTPAAIDHRIGRWLSIRGDRGRREFAFAHPRLAEAFAEALGDASDTAVEDLVEWMRSAWMPRGRLGGSAYALDWLPTHLERSGPREKREAAVLLSSPTFLAARLKDPAHAARRLGATIDAWHDLPFATRNELPGSRPWSAFWAENETSLRHATAEAAWAGSDTVLPMLHCLGDTRTAGSDRSPPPSRALFPHPPADRGLLRSIESPHAWGLRMFALDDALVSLGVEGGIRFWSRRGSLRPGGDPDAHRGCVQGLLALDDALVSWGEDGGIRFWGHDGSRRGGGDPKAHNGSVRGVLSVGDALVSWGEDGDIKYWGHNGSRRAGGAANAHRGGVRGMLALGDALVSWGEDGAIRFWGRDGRLRPGGDEMAHGGAVEGVLVVDDALVSWGEDRAIRFWGCDGSRKPEEVVGPHNGSVTGVLAVDDALVSWGEDGAIRFWGRDGSLRPGGGRGHRSEVWGVLAVDDVLVSWGEDGAIRFWGRDGSLRQGGADHAHMRSVRYVIDIGNALVSVGNDGLVRFWGSDGSPRMSQDFVPHRFEYAVGLLSLDDVLVSWNQRGTIRFWSRDGGSTVEGDQRAIEDSIVSVLALDDALVSRGRGGAIRFWGHDGSRRAGGDPKAHNGYVQGLLTVGDALVSWGSDGAIHFWGHDGSRRAGGDPAAHDGGVEGVLVVDDALVSWGADGAIRFWGRDGSPRPGGDRRAHKEPVGCVLAFRDVLVSWSRQGGNTYMNWRSIRFWGRDGNRLAGGDGCAHVGAVRGLAAIEDAFVSWGSDGAIRFWGHDGSRRVGGLPKAHDGSVEGVLSVDDALVSWGSDGAINFWGHDGSLREGGDANAHRGYVRGLLALDDALVSWGSDGAIRFWGHDGSRRAGGDPKAHNGYVQGLRTVGDALVSWGSDGAIHFWGHDGSLREGGDANAHRGGVRGMLALDDALVSWGKDGAIRFWGRDGSPRPWRDHKAHGDGVQEVLDVGDALAGWSSDGLVRLWNREGLLLDIIAVASEGARVFVWNNRILKVGRAVWAYEQSKREV